PHHTLHSFPTRRSSDLVQFGGQTPLNLASGLKAAGVPILGTQTESIETAEDRKLFAAMLDKLGLRQTPNGSATSAKEAVAIAKKDRKSTRLNSSHVAIS